MKYYYINLDRAVDRNKHAIKEIRKSKILSSNIERISAVDGSKIDINDVPNNIVKKTAKEQLLQPNKRFGLSLTYGAIGCALTHYKLYKKCIDLQQDFLILEDDIIIPNYLDHYLENYIEYFRYDLLYFGFHRHSHTIMKNIHPMINRISGNIWGTFAYVVTPRFCNYAINNIFPIEIQFDSEISKHINKNKVTALAFNDNLIKPVHLGSDIQGDNGMLRTDLSNNYTDIADGVFDVR